MAESAIEATRVPTIAETRDRYCTFVDELKEGRGFDARSYGDLDNVPEEHIEKVCEAMKAYFETRSTVTLL